MLSLFGCRVSNVEWRFNILATFLCTAGYDAIYVFTLGGIYVL